MFEKTFVKEYFTNPFFWWGIIMLVFTTFSAVLVVNLAMQAIIMDQLYVPILFGSLTIAFILTLYPIRRGLRQLFEKRETKKSAIIFLSLIVLLFYTDVIYFLSDPPIIFSTLDSTVIADKPRLDYALNVKTLAEFIGLPLLSSFVFTLIKRKLIDEGYKIDDEFRNNYRFAAYIIMFNTIMYFLFIFITNLNEIINIVQSDNNFNLLEFFADYDWIIAVVGLCITIIIFTLAEHKKRKVESAQLTLNLGQRMYSKEIKDIRSKIYSALDLKKDLLILTVDNKQNSDQTVVILERELDAYLNELEQIALFVNKGVLDKEFAYEMFGFQFVSVRQYEPISKYLKEQRNTIQKDLWNQFETAYEKFVQIQNKKKVKIIQNKYSESKAPESKAPESKAPESKAPESKAPEN